MEIDESDQVFRYGSQPYQHTNLMLRLEAESGEGESSEVYAKVIQLVDERGRTISFTLTTGPSGLRKEWQRLTGWAKNS